MSVKGRTATSSQCAILEFKIASRSVDLIRARDLGNVELFESQLRTIKPLVDAYKPLREKLVAERAERVKAKQLAWHAFNERKGQ